MKKHPARIFLTLSLVLVIVPVFAQDNGEPLKYFKDMPRADNLDSQADQGAAFFQRRAGEAKGRMGSATAVYGAQKGKPIVHYFIRKDRLASYENGQDPKALLGRASLVTYPLVSASGVVGEVDLSWDGSQWKVVSTGGAAYAQKWDALRQSLSSQTGMDSDRFFAVRVPALDLDFIGYEDQGTLFLAPLKGNPILGWTAGVAMPASEIFRRSAPLAQNYQDRSFRKN